MLEPLPPVDEERVEPLFAEPADLPAEQNWSKFWRVLPTGIVPHFGPHTTEANRYSGWGPRLTETSWLARPLFIGAWGGMANGGPLIHGRVDQATTSIVGFEYGWDYDHRWGLEKRASFLPLRVSDVNLPTPSRSGHAEVGEYRLLYYPWGDTRWRPYVEAAPGLAGLHFRDDQGHSFHRAVFAASYGLGLKYLIGERWVWRMECADIVIPGNGELSTVHNFTVNSGLELRFGWPKRWLPADHREPCAH